MIYFQNLEKMAFFVRGEFFYVREEFHFLVEIRWQIGGYHLYETLKSMMGHNTNPYVFKLAEIVSLLWQSLVGHAFYYYFILRFCGGAER